MEEQREKLLSGVLEIIQPDTKDGPRVNVDTILLANFARPKQRERVLEIGCAHGAVSLILAKRGYSITGIDIQPHLIEMARHNAEINGLSDKTEFITMDITKCRENWEAQHFNRIIVNPPYDDPGSCRVSPSKALATANHGTQCTLRDMITSIKYLLNNRGYLDIVIRANRLGELFGLMNEFNIAPKKLKTVHPAPGRPASVVLVEGLKAAGHGITVAPPLFIKDEHGNETEELLKAYRIEE